MNWTINHGQSPNHPETKIQVIYRDGHETTISGHRDPGLWYLDDSDEDILASRPIQPKHKDTWNRLLVWTCILLVGLNLIQFWIDPTMPEDLIASIRLFSILVFLILWLPVVALWVGRLGKVRLHRGK